VGGSERGWGERGPVGMVVGWVKLRGEIWSWAARGDWGGGGRKVGSLGEQGKAAGGCYVE